MNMQYFRYALEVEKTGSITQAANNLFMSQPTLSKAIKDMEEEIGFPVFKRTSKGVVPTYRGTVFLSHARKIAAQIQKMERSIQRENASYKMFSLVIPRVGYIAQTVSEYVSTFDGGNAMEVDILETNSMRIIESVADGQYVLGLIRCHAEDRDYFLKSLGEKDLQYTSVWCSDYVALMQENHPLAHKSKLSADDFLPYVEIAFGDEKVPYIRISEAETVSGSLYNPKRILVYDRATQFDLLQANSFAYMWTSLWPAEVLKRYGLVQRECCCAGQFEDFLIYRACYRFSPMDRTFIDRLYLQRNMLAFGK